METSFSPVFILAYIFENSCERDGKHIFGIMVVGQVSHDYMIAAPVIPVEEVPLCVGAVLSATCYDFRLFQMIVWFSKVGT